jgi:hypothetical protein
VACTRRVIERGLKPGISIAITHAPDGGAILLDLVAHDYHALSSFRTTQKNLRTASNAQGRLPIAQELPEGSLIFGIQHQRLRLSTAHGFTPVQAYT